MAKPKDLKWPCSTCDKWEEKEYITHDVPATAFWNGMKNRVCLCKYDPRHASPEKALLCPYRRYFTAGAFPMVRVACDFCNKILMEFPLDQVKNIDFDGQYVCSKCLKNNLILNDLTTNGKLITEKQLKSENIR